MAESDRDKPVKIPLDPVTAVKALLRVDPNSEPVEDEDDKDEGPAK